MVRPRLSASRPASKTCSGGWKSGSPAVMAMTSMPWRLSSVARVLQAIVDDALSRLQVWRGWLETGFAAGDLQPFLRVAGGY